MATPWVFSQSLKIRNQLPSQGIQVNIPDQLKQIGILLTQNGFIAVLKQDPASLMAPIKAPGIPTHHTSHQVASRRLTRPEQQVKVVGHEGPGVTAIADPGETGRQAGKKVGSILIGTENSSPFNASAHHMIQRPRQMQTRLSRHGDKDKEKLVGCL